MRAAIIGDLHGRYKRATLLYESLIAQIGPIDLLIQVGDFGYFPNIYNSPEWEYEFDHPCWFVDGNHDNHRALRSLQEGDFTVAGDPPEWSTHLLNIPHRIVMADFYWGGDR